MRKNHRSWLCVPTGKAISNWLWSPVRLRSMRPARVPSASRCGRSTRPPAIACASSSLMKTPANRSPPSTKAAATRWPNVTTITVPWSSPVPAAVKGIIHVPAYNTPIKAGRREALLIAIAKARQWIDDLAHGRAASFAVIARREGKAERHIRLLAPLAFVSPQIVSALLDGSAPADLTLTKLARALPYCWAEQERRVHLQRFPCSLD